ncbi:MAG: site-2 protease family protein [Bacillota bacterium]
MLPDLQWILIGLPGLVAGFAFHEYAHAWIAYRQGDVTPKAYGRLTLEPWAHMDLLGTVLLLVYGFGWAKPVPVNPYNFRHPRQGMLKVALAGPLMNIVVAMCFLLLGRLVPGPVSIPFLREIFWAGASVNVGLAVFNMLPIPPLDGSKILAGLVPGEVATYIDRLEQYGPILLVVLVSTGMLRGLLGVMIDLAQTALVRSVYAITWFIPW